MEESPGVIGYEEGGCWGVHAHSRHVTPATPVYSPTGKLSKTLLLEILWRFHNRDMID